MPNLGLIDDRVDSRLAFKLKIKLPLKKMYKEWDIIDTSPFERLEDYDSWILENEISAIIIDEKLDEGHIDSEIGHSEFLGHQVVQYLRNRFKELPIYCVTSYARTEELNKSFKSFNLILKRRDFDEKQEEYINLIVQTGNQFYLTNKKQLETLAILSQKIASGDANELEKNEILSIQANLSLPHGKVNLERENWLGNFSSHLTNLENIEKEIDEFLKDG